MAQLQQRGQVESLLSELGEIARSIGSSFHLHGSMSRRSSSVAPISDDDNNEQLCASVERLPSSDRERKYVFDGSSGAEKNWEGNRDVDVTKLGALEKQLLIDKLIQHVVNDNLRLLQLSLVIPTELQQHLAELL